MSLIHQYILEFNKLVSSTNFISSSNDISIKNKLFLIQQDINDEVDFDSFESHKFFSNIYHILSQSSDPKSTIAASCLDVLLRAIQSRNKTVMNIVKEINFLPALTKVVMSFVNEEYLCDNLLKLLDLINKLIRFNGDIDEHNMKILILSLRDMIDLKDEKITKLSIHILSNLAMCNENAKYIINRNIRTTDMQQKISQVNDLIAIKLLIITYGGFLAKDFPNLIKISVKNICESVSTFDSEALIQSIDMLKYAKKSCNNEACLNVSDMAVVLELFRDLNDNLTKTVEEEDNVSEPTREFMDHVFDYYSLLLELDVKLSHTFEDFTARVFENSSCARSASALKFLANFVRFGGTFSSLDKTIESIIEFFNNNSDDDSKIIGSNQKCEFLKLLEVLHKNEQLKSTHFKAALEYTDYILKAFENLNIKNIDEDMIRLFVYTLQTLNALSQDCKLFRDCLEKVLRMSFLPCILAEAYLLKNEEILQTLFSLTSMEKFPNAQIASILAKTSRPKSREASSSIDREVSVRESGSVKVSKYVNSYLQQELNDLIQKINQKLDNDTNGLKESDVIYLYRQKCNYLQDHLTAVTESLRKYADLYNEAQQQNVVLRKLGEKQEIINWSLQLDKENYMKENKNLETKNRLLGSSIDSFKNKIDKEISQNSLILKQIAVKDKEIERLRAEKSTMESEKQKFRQAQKENENRIQELKKSLEEEKKLRETEVVTARSEQKRIAQNAEKEHTKFQEVIKLNEQELMQKQKRIAELETELKEAEKIQTSIMSIMQKSKK